MSASIQVLQDGYSRWKTKPRSMYANGTSTLILSDEKRLIVDTLGPWDRDKLLQHFSERHLLVEDINVVIGTHLHTDHIGNLNLFPRSLQIVGDQRSENDYFEFDIFNGEKKLTLCPNVELFFTPGHTSNDVSTVVYNVDKLGTVAIVGDLFESEADLTDDSIWIEAGSDDPKLQKENRQLILSIADYIVPGHGKMFKVPK